MTNKIVLASASPRRRELLKKITPDFTVRVSGAEEKTEEGLKPCEIVISLARQKAAAVEIADGETIIAADTLVAINDTVLGKPRDAQDAKRMLTLLSGKTHFVYTGVCIRTGKGSRSFYEETAVTFRELSEKEIDDYIATGEPVDKAGAYGIQGEGGALVKSINGDFDNVVGLPVEALEKALEDDG